MQTQPYGSANSLSFPLSATRYNQEVPLLLHPALADALSRGVTLLTPNQRAARAIRQAFDRAQIAAGVSRWEPPQVFPLDTWLARLWHRRIVAGAETSILLNSSPQHVLWRELIADDPEVPGLHSLDALAAMAARAWSLVCLYEGRDRLRSSTFSADSRAFERWALRFARRLERDSLTTPAQLPDELATSGDLPSTSLAWVDFDSFSPALQRLRKALESAGAVLEMLSTAETPVTAYRLAAQDDADELHAAALWIRDHLAANPAASIAVVVPDLAARRAPIERVFAPILTPEQLPITSAPAPPRYEFSLGRPLAELPMVRAALDILRWSHAPLSLDQISDLFLSPWFSPETLAAAAEFDAFEIRKLPLLRPELTLQGTLRLAQRSRRAPMLAALISQLRALRAAAESLGSSHSFTQWSDSFRALLQASGWTGNADRTSLNFQQHRSFESALDELATLDATSHEALPDLRHALSGFTYILQQTLFAPESQNAPVQILGPLEVGGVAFDALWFLGADDLAWPIPPAPSPLLSRPLQRSLAIPGADPARDEARALALTQRIAASAASEVVFSYARTTPEGERRPSALLDSLALEPLPLKPRSVPKPSLPLVQAADDLHLPPLPSPEVRGGTRILQLQAACAFRAFAEQRLWSSSPGTRENGLSPIDQGNLVHKVMQHFWADLQTQAALRALTKEERYKHLDRAIRLAVDPMHSDGETTWDHAYLSVQRARLHRMLGPWLDYELQRPEFTVLNNEEKKEFQLGPLNFSLRIDRIDSTAFGEVIIDYKTGLVSPAKWNGERPDEPQLPLYAVLAQHEGGSLAGVAFAQLRAGQDLGLSGYADYAAALAPAKPAQMETAPLAGQVVAWHNVLSALAEAYAEGESTVLPKSYPDTCKYCGQRTLCRLDPDALGLSDDETDEDYPGRPSFELALD